MKNSKIRILKVLERAKKRISKKENWLRQVLYQSGSNSFCLLGALLPEKEIRRYKKKFANACYNNYAIFKNKNSVCHDAAQVLAKTIGLTCYGEVYGYNDRSSYKQVMEVLDRAINNLKNQITNK